MQGLAQIVKKGWLGTRTKRTVNIHALSRCMPASLPVGLHIPALRACLPTHKSRCCLPTCALFLLIFEMQYCIKLVAELLSLSEVPFPQKTGSPPHLTEPK